MKAEEDKDDERKFDVKRQRSLCLGPYSFPEYIYKGGIATVYLDFKKNKKNKPS
jgi:hypothetical protein